MINITRSPNSLGRPCQHAFLMLNAMYMSGVKLFGQEPAISNQQYYAQRGALNNHSRSGHC